MALRYMHIVIPQGTPENKKLESLFQELLVNMWNTFTGKRISLEYYGFAQYTYFFIVLEENLYETVEGLIYSTFPDAEVKEKQDYTLNFDPKKQALVGAEVSLHHSDIYPVKTFDQFEEDSGSRLFSVISKIGRDDQVWVQIIAEPQNDTGAFHYLRNWRRRRADVGHFFSVRDRLREGGRKGVSHRRHEKALEKTTVKPYRVSIRCAYIAENETDAGRKLDAVTSSFSQFNEKDINEFHAHHVSNSSRFIEQFRARTHATNYILNAKETATLYHFPNADYVPHIVHVLARKSDPPQDLPPDGARGVGQSHSALRSRPDGPLRDHPQAHGVSLERGQRAHHHRVGPEFHQGDRGWTLRPAGNLLRFQPAVPLSAVPRLKREGAPRNLPFFRTPRRPTQRTGKVD